jgi:hypothetical protein
MHERKLYYEFQKGEMQRVNVTLFREKTQA